MGFHHRLASRSAPIPIRVNPRSSAWKKISTFNLSRYTLSIRLVLAILLLSTAAFADDALSHLRADYQKKVFLLRGFYQDSLLRYDLNGQIKHRAETGPWTTAYVLIKSVDSNNGGFTFKAIRVAQIFDTKKRIFRSGRTDLPVIIEIEADPANDAALRRALANIFIGDHESLAQLVPEPWRDLIARIDSNGVLAPVPKAQPVADNCETTPTVDTPCRVGKSVKPPKIISAPDPSFSDIARAARMRGTSVLSTVIDETGHTQKIRVVTPLGCGLDDKAFEAIRRWSFQPGSRDGHPVPVQISVEINFNWQN